MHLLSFISYLCKYLYIELSICSCKKSSNIKDIYPIKLTVKLRQLRRRVVVQIDCSVSRRTGYFVVNIVIVNRILRIQVVGMHRHSRKPLWIHVIREWINGPNSQICIGTYRDCNSCSRVTVLPIYWHSRENLELLAIEDEDDGDIAVQKVVKNIVTESR